MTEAVRGRLHVRDEGNGRAVLLLHGVGGDHSLWNAQIGALSARYRVLAPDLRGHGRSDLPEGSKLSFEEIEADLTALLDERGIEKVHVGGISAGAFVAFHWAMRAPERFHSVILCGGATHCDAHTRAVGRGWQELYRTEGFDAFFLRLVKDIYAADWIEANLDAIDRLREEMRGRDFRGAFLYSRAAEAYDLRGRLGRFGVPVLVLHGMDDRVVDSSHARLIRQSVARAQVRLFPLTGHMVPVERPEASTETLFAWLDGGGTPSGLPEGSSKPPP